MSTSLNEAPPTSSTPRPGDTELSTQWSHPTRLIRTVLADDTSTHESQSQASQTTIAPKRKTNTTRTKARRNALSRKRESKPPLTEGNIIKWAEEESKTHPESVCELGQILLSIAQTSPAAQVKQEEQGVETINWQEVSRTVVEESKLGAEIGMASTAKAQKRHRKFCNPGCKPKTIIKRMIHYDDDDSPMIEDLPAEDETPDKSTHVESPTTTIDKTETLLERQQSSEEKLESLSFEEASSFLTSDIDPDFGKELSQEFKTLNVPISVPLSRVYSAHEPSSPEIDIENPVATPPPSVIAKQEPTQTNFTTNTPNTITSSSQSSIQQKPSDDGSKLQNRLSHHIRPNPLLVRWTLHKQTQQQ